MNIKVCWPNLGHVEVCTWQIPQGT